MELSSCPVSWQDVFVTKASDESLGAIGSNYTFDDVFCSTVQTVEFDPDGDEGVPGTSDYDPNGASKVVAYITEADSPWILPTWTTEYSTTDAAKSEYKNIEVGDLVRIGGIHTDGFTNYLTVMERREITHVANACSSAVKVTQDTSRNNIIHDPEFGQDVLAIPSTTANPALAPQIAVAKGGIAHIALRLNASVNATRLNGTVLDQSKTSAIHRQQVASATDKQATLETRDHAYEYITNNRKAYPTEVTGTERYFYPLYLNKRWKHSNTLNVKLDHTMKQVQAVKLMGYSLLNQRQVGIQHAHEMNADDYFILRIKDIQGRVISNNKFANGAFAVLQTGTTGHNLIGAAEYSRHEPEGIVCVPLNTSNNKLGNLTIEVIDRMGNPAHFGRFHLWFKLLVTHG